jgi:membrane fusion protein (multidrug efflux system)
VVAEARATVGSDQAALAFSNQDYVRYDSLSKTGAGTVQSAQKSAADIREKQASLDHDTAAVGAAEKQIDVLGTQVVQARAVLAQEQAVMHQAELNVSYTTITSPTDGTVGARSLRAGQYVQAGTQLMAVVPLSAVYIIANYKETQLTDVHAGQTVTIVVDTFLARPCMALSIASPRQVGRNSRCCRLTTRPATSRRSSNASPSKSSLTPLIR